MKKLSKLICAVLVLALLCSSLIFTVSAEDAATDSEHDFEPNLIHSESSFSGVNTLFENVVASDVEGNLFSGSSTGNAQDILSVAGSDSEEFSYITFYANKDGSIEKKNPFYQLNADSPNISVEAGSSAYYVIDFDVATHGNILSYLDVSVMLRRVSDGGGFPFSANVPFAEYVSEDGTWSHVTVVGDIAANEVHIFVNGEYKATPGFAYNADQLSGNKSLSPKGIRIDSGDLAYLTKKARKMLDDAGFPEVKICVSGDIDEHVMTSLTIQGAKVDNYGIGTKLITSHSHPSLGGVYKLAAIDEGEEKLTPKIKVSNTTEKITNPGYKKVMRIYVDGYAAADLIALKDEEFDDTKPLTVFHPVETWKKMTFTDYKIKEITTKIIDSGKVVYKLPDVKEIIAFAKVSFSEFWEEYKRIVNPHVYKVDLSDKLYELKKKLLSEAQKGQN